MAPKLIFSLAILALPIFAQSEPATLFLLRHAERSGPETADPITSVGQERAQLLARMFGEAKISLIVVSDALRSQQTAAPLAEKLQLKPQMITRGDYKALVATFSGLAPGSAALSARHGGEIESIVEKLGGGKLPAITEQEYDRLIIVTILQGKAVSVRTLRYGK